MQVVPGQVERDAQQGMNPSGDISSAPANRAATLSNALGGAFAFRVEGELEIGLHPNLARARVSHSETLNLPALVGVDHVPACRGGGPTP